MSKRGAVRVGLVLVLVCVGLVISGALLSRAGMRSAAEDAWTEVVLQQDKDGYRGCVDTRIYAARPNENHGCMAGEGDAWCELQVGERGKPPVDDSNELRSLVRFEVRTCAEDAPDGACIPQGASICQATLALYAHNAGQLPEVPIVAGAYEVLRAWEEMESTWNRATASDAWEVEGCDGDTDRSAEPLDETEIDRREAWYEWDVTPAVVRWFEDPDSNKGLIVLQTDDCDIPPGCEWDIRHSEYGGKSERPKLIIRYAREPSKIVVVKQSIGADGTFTFTSDTLTPPTFTLTTVDGAASREFDGLIAGTYAVTETDPGPGWELIDATCDDGSDPNAISLDCGETVTCTFVDGVLWGKIVVVKQTIGGDDTFTFTSDTLTPPTFTLTTVDGTASREFDDLMPGTYDVTEIDLPEGWGLQSAICDDGSDPSAISLDAGETVTCTFTDSMMGRIVVVKDAIGGDGTFCFTSQTLPGFCLTTVGGKASREFLDLEPGTYDVTETDLPEGWGLQSAICDDGSDPSAISLEAGETVTCSFTDSMMGKIVVVKDAIGGDGTFCFESETLTPPTFCLTTDGGTASREFLDLEPGTYDVAETDLPEGWGLQSAVCDDGSDPSAISLEAGETVTCSFTDSMMGRIVVVKEAIGGDGTFCFESQTLPDFCLTTIGGKASREFPDLEPGAYDVEESEPPPGWMLVGASCDDGSDPSAISVEPGETVTCTFENRFISAGRIYIPVIFKAWRVPCVPQCVEWNFFEEPFGDISANEWVADKPGPGAIDVTDGWLHMYTTEEHPKFPLLWRDFQDLGDCFCISITFRYQDIQYYGTTISLNSERIGDLFKGGVRRGWNGEEGGKKTCPDFAKLPGQEECAPDFLVPGIENILSIHQNVAKDDNLPDFEVRLIRTKNKWQWERTWKRCQRASQDKGSVLQHEGAMHRVYLPVVFKLKYDEECVVGDFRTHWVQLTFDGVGYKLYVDGVLQLNYTGTSEYAVCDDDPGDAVCEDWRPRSIYIGSHADMGYEDKEDFEQNWTEILVDHIGIWSRDAVDP